MADRVVWPALILRGNDDTSPDLIAAFLDDFAVAAIEDFAHMPLPPGGLWDPTYPPVPDPPPSPLHWRVFFASSADRDRAAEALGRAHAEISVERDDVPDEDWAARSQRELTAITAGAFIVAPPWDRPTAVPAGTRVIVIEPSRGFGTGHHASTRLCLRALSDVDPRGKRLLDLGTGSGVLAMAAALKDAREVLAIDVDPDAIESARASAALNPGVESIQWLVGDFREPRWVEMHGGPWDVVLANLTGGMLISAAARVRASLAQGGTLIASGFDESEHAAVADALQLTPQASFSEQSWVGVILRRG